MDGPYGCKTVSELGLDGMQLEGGWYLNGFHISQKVIQDAYLEMGRKYNIEFSSIAVLELDFYSMFGTRGSLESKVAFMAIKTSVDAARDMKIPTILIPNFEKSQIRSKNDFDVLIEVFKETCDYAMDNGIIIASENVLSVEENLLLFEKVKRENFKLYFDTQNPYLHKRYNVSEVIERLFPYIIEVHVKDGKDCELSAAVLGEGDSGFYNSIDTLNKLDYTGWIVLENYYDREPLRQKNNNYFELIRQDINILRDALD